MVLCKSPTNRCTYNLDINPFKYLIAPRILASVIVFPILIVCADLIGIFV
ncbi:MAG: ABC transporter permease [Wolbachia sp.]